MLASTHAPSHSTPPLHKYPSRFPSLSLSQSLSHPLSLPVSPAQVRIAEFNSKPVQCRLTGSAFPGAGRDAALAATTAANTAAAAAVAATLGRGERTAAAATANGKHGGGGGATASGLKGADLATMEALEGGLVSGRCEGVYTRCFQHS